MVSAPLVALLLSLLATTQSSAAVIKTEVSRISHERVVLPNGTITSLDLIKRQADLAKRQEGEYDCPPTIYKQEFIREEKNVSGPDKPVHPVHCCPDTTCGVTVSQSATISTSYSVGFSIGADISLGLAKEASASAGFEMGYSWGEELSAETSNECGAPGEFVEPDGLKPGEKYPKPCFQNVFKPKINRVHFKIYERDYCSVDSEWVYLRDGYAEVPILNHVATLNKGKKVPDGSWDCTRECQELAVDLSLMCTAKGSS